MNHKIISIENEIYYQSQYFRVLKIEEQETDVKPILRKRLTPSSRIIFLDIDNILNRADIFAYLPLFERDREIKAPEIREFIDLKYPRFIIELGYLDMLTELQQQINDLNYVIISSWRKHFSYQIMKKYLSPLNIVGVVSGQMKKIEAILDWWDRFIKDRSQFQPNRVIILDDNIIEEPRPYTPGINIELVRDDQKLDSLFKQCLLIPMSYGCIRTPNEDDMNEIRRRFANSYQ